MKYILSIFIFFFCLNLLQAQIISNGSFENASVDPGGVFIVLPNGSTDIDNWVVGGNGIDYVGGYWEASDGDRSIDVNAGDAGSISQTFTTETGETYNLQFDLAGNPACAPFVKTLEVSVANEVQTFTFDATGNDFNNMGWQTESFDFVATGTSTTLNFESLTPFPCGPTIDNVQVLLYDCAGVAGGTAEIDECGECLDPNDPEFNQSCADCNGIPNGPAITDECGVCLDPNDPEFNQSCVDCAGTPNGTAVIDQCGLCLEPDDPFFDISCIDCAGTPFGTAVIDDCGECLDPNDPEFNQSCVDCAGIPNGTAVIDDCGECLEPNDPEFNQSCVDCAGIPNGTAVIDDCGECLEPNDPEFNQSCVDCAGIPNGTAVIDDCGECLAPNDPEFNQSCVDCAGTPNGTAVFDDCGECLEPNDPEFNQSCVDCAGTPNGTAVIDDCGECLDPNDPEFNQSCIEEEDDLFIPNVFSPNYDGFNDQFKVFKKSETNAQIKLYRIFSRWGELIHQSENFSFGDHSFWWNGEFKGEKMPEGVYIYYIEVLFQNGELRNLKGEIIIAR